MHFAGVASTTAITLADLQATTLLYKWGFGVMREVMPLTNGMTSHSALCGIVALSAGLVLTSWRTTLGRKLFTVAALGAALYGLAVTDGRAAIAAGGGLFLIAAFTPWLRARVLRYAGWLMLVSVPLFLTLAALVPRDWLAVVARSGMAAEIVEGDSRVKIWSAIWRAVVEQPLDFVFGFGLYGQVTSGIGSEISRLFVAWGGSSYYSAHNAGMQVLLDGGIVALAVFIWFYNSALSGASQSYSVKQEPEDKLALALLLYVLLVGVLDTVGTMVWREVFFAMIILGSRYAPVRAVRREPVVIPGVFNPI
jgi:O-antigen ligase